MPNGRILHARFEKAVDDTVDPTTTLDYFNAALLDLAPYARIATKQILPITASTVEIPLPAEQIVELRQVIFRLASGAEWELTEVPGVYGAEVIENQYIELKKPFGITGNVEIRFYRPPILMTSLDEIPEIHEMFHDALVHYAAREFFDADEEDTMSAKEGAKYMAAVTKMNEFTLNRGSTAHPVIMNAAPPWARR